MLPPTLLVWLLVFGRRLAPAWPALALTLLGEFTERYLFFRAVDAPKMPGLPSVALAQAGA